jgi:hypothetical protein
MFYNLYIRAAVFHEPKDIDEFYVQKFCYFPTCAVIRCIVLI